MIPDKKRLYIFLKIAINKRMVRNKFSALVIFLFLLSTSLHTSGQKQPIDYVNNRIGNISILLVPTFPTVHLPNSMLRMNTGHHDFVTLRMDGLPLNSPMHRHGDAFIFKPYSGKLKTDNPEFKYKYDQETIKPYFYEVVLDEYDIHVAFAPSERSAIYSVEFASDSNYIMIRTRDKSNLTVKGNTISGHQNYFGIKHYFFLEFDRQPQESGILDKGNHESVWVRFDKKDKKINARYGISYISAEQAEENLRKEIKDFNVTALSNKARNIWNQTLGKIKIEGGTEDQKTVFYTSLYRAHERMVNTSEYGKYFSGYDQKIHTDNIPFYTDDWAWDTYMALHPLQTILNPKTQAYKVQSYIRMYEQSGFVPTFPTVFGDVHYMNGNHASLIFLDAWRKGIKFDINKAVEGMKKTVLEETMIPWRKGPNTVADEFYHKNGWFPALHPGEKETIPNVSDFEQRQAVAVSLAASLNDWAIGEMAKYAGRRNDYEFFNKRSYNYRNLFNKKTGFFHPKDSAGNFIEPFDYIFSGGTGARAYYAENNAWTYIWDVRHDFADLIEMMGGKEPFANKLDQLFVQDLTKPKWQYYGIHPDATGSVGQFVMGNEPSFHIPYLYNYAGKPWETQKLIRTLLQAWYRNDLMGIPGDEDGGGMTAFVVFSSLGFFPPTAGIPVYTIGSPLFTKSEIFLENGRKFTVIAKNSSWKNKYITSAKLNGKELNRTWFTHADIINGGTLELIMNDKPNKNWATSPDAAPPTGRTWKEN